MKRRRLHQIVFVAAAVYNVGWGLFSAASPQWLFRFADLPLMVHPQIFASLAMVVGVYGILYLEVARRPEAGFLLAAVGLLGKVLGPAGWAWLYLNGLWPGKTIVLCLFNDLIWWIPFTIYLIDAWPSYRQTWQSNGKSL